MMFILLAILATVVYGFACIQENCWRNRKIGVDPKTRQWHLMQSVQVGSFFAIVCILGYRQQLWLYELPLLVGYWVCFQGFTNLYTFHRPWWYVGDKADIAAHGSAMDRWFLRRKNPENALQLAQAVTLVFSLLPLTLHYLLFK